MNVTLSQTQNRVNQYQHSQESVEILYNSHQPVQSYVKFLSVSVQSLAASSFHCTSLISSSANVKCLGETTRRVQMSPAILLIG